MKKELASQLAASFEMLKNAINSASEEAWISGDPPFWQHAFHIINTLDFYFSTFDSNILFPNEEYKLPDDLRKHAGKGFFNNKSKEFINKKEILTFLSGSRNRIKNYFEKSIEDQFGEPSGFNWLPFNKYELILYNMRHIMEHVTILNQMLKTNGIEAAKWIGINEL